MSKIWSERAPGVIGKHIGGFFQFPSLLANYSPFNTSFIGCEPLRKSAGTAAALTGAAVSGSSSTGAK